MSKASLQDEINNKLPIARKIYLIFFIIIIILLLI
jgi:hypothetical protein